MNNKKRSNLSHEQIKKTPIGASSKHSFMSKLPPLPGYLICFISLWIFASTIYDDMFYMSEQYSMFAFDKLLMEHTLNLPFGWLIVCGRLMLLTFHYPVLGGLILSLILTLIVWIINYLFNLKGIKSIFPIILPFAFLSYLISKGINLYYQQEPSITFIIPGIALLIVSILALLKRVISRKPIRKWYWIDKEEAKVTTWLQCITPIILTCLITIAGFHFVQNDILTARLQRLMQQQQWDEMIKTALKAKQPSRSIAAYYAIALLQTNQLNERLFEINYQYPDMNLVNQGGIPDDGTDLYAADCDFTTGLVQTSYHHAMERMVVDGPSCHTLKRLYLCSLLNNETALAQKYLSILKRIPFQDDFLSKYGPMLTNRKLIAEDAELRQILDMQPIQDSFEQQYQKPVFLGYNMALSSGKSQRALQASIAACLYAKQLTAAIVRTQPLIGNSLPNAIEQAVVMESYKNPRLKEAFPISPITSSTVDGFLRTCSSLPSKDPLVNAELLKDTYKNFYPYYYYFENIPDETQIKKYENAQKGGVN